jgi:hypothetical protein
MRRLSITLALVSFHRQPANFKRCCATCRRPLSISPEPISNPLGQAANALSNVRPLHVGRRKPCCDRVRPAWPVPSSARAHPSMCLRVRRTFLFCTPRNRRIRCCDSFSKTALQFDGVLGIGLAAGNQKQRPADTEAQKYFFANKNSRVDRCRIIKRFRMDRQGKSANMMFARRFDQTGEDSAVSLRTIFINSSSASTTVCETSGRCFSQRPNQLPTSQEGLSFE